MNQSATQRADLPPPVQSASFSWWFEGALTRNVPAPRVFDHRVALYDRINARYIVQACNDSGCSDSAELAVPGALESAIGYLEADGGNREDAFGTVVRLSTDGSTLAVGSSTRVNNLLGETYNSMGKVYVCERVGGEWQPPAYLTADISRGAATGLQGGSFGNAISLSADGKTLVVGASEETSAATGINGDGDDNSAFGAGAAYVFKQVDGAWAQRAYLRHCRAWTYRWWGVRFFCKVRETGVLTSRSRCSQHGQRRGRTRSPEAGRASQAIATPEIAQIA